MNVDSDFENVVVEKYLAGKSGIVIAKELGIPIHKVYISLKNAGIKARSNKVNSRKFIVNDDYFSEIDSEQKAYWLGFLQADGYVTSKNYCVGLALATKDIDHLHKFKNAIGATYEIKTYFGSGYSTGQYSRIVVRSEKMWNDLVGIGIGPRKTFTAEPLLVADGLTRHYVRGLMDGDGSIKKSEKSKSGYAGNFISMSHTLVNFVAKELNGGDGVWLDSHKNVWYVDFSWTLEKLDYLYADSTVYLQRKFDRAIHARKRLLGIA